MYTPAPRHSCLWIPLILCFLAVSAQAQVELPTEFISVGDYTGTANERINAAIAAAMATDHKTVYFPNDTYALRTGLSLSQGVNTEIHLIGESEEGVLLIPDIPYLQANYNGGDWENGGARLAHMINLGKSGGPFESLNVSIQNMTIDMRHEYVMGAVPGDQDRTYNVVGHGLRVGTGWETGQYLANHVTIRNVGSYGVGIQDRDGHPKNNITLSNLNIERTGSDGIDTKEASGDGNRNLVIRDVNINEVGFLDTGAAPAIDIRYRTFTIENVNLVSTASKSTLPGQTSNVSGISVRPVDNVDGGVIQGTVTNAYLRGFNTSVNIHSSDTAQHNNIAVSNFKIQGQTASGVRILNTNHSGHSLNNGFVDPSSGGFLSLNGQATATNVVNQRWDPSLTPTTHTTFEDHVTLGNNETFSPAWEGYVGSERISLNPASLVSGPLLYDVGNGVMQIDYDGFYNVMDKLIVNGALNLDGELSVNVIDGSPTTPGVFQVFEADTITGSFDTITLPSAAPGLTWNTSDLTTTGTISLEEIAPAVISVLDTGFASTNNDHGSNKPPESGDFAYDSNTKQYSYTFNTGTDSDMLVVSISVEKSGDPLSVTFDGQPLEEAVSSSNGSGASIWYLANPSATGELIIDAGAVDVFNGMGVGIASLVSLDEELTSISLDTIGSSNNSTSVDITTTIDGSFVMVGADANGSSASVSLNAPLMEIGVDGDVGSSKAGSGFENDVDAGSFTYGWNPNGEERGMVAAAFITAAELLAGDYNDDGIVDLADYTVWRNSLGAPAGTLPNDSDGGVIGAAQYATWKANFGSLTAISSQQSAVVPEPSAFLLLGLGFLLARRVLSLGK